MSPAANWRDDEAFVDYLVVVVEVAYRLYNTVVHRIKGGEEGVNIVWESWKEGVAEGEEMIQESEVYRGV